MLKIATWNVNSIKIRLPQVLQWLAEHQPDVLALQETKSVNENFPRAEIEAAGYRVTFSGQKSYNGVAIITRHDASNIITDIPDLSDPQRRILAATINDVRIINLYIPNGESLTSEKYLYKLTWLEKINNYVQYELKQNSHLIILGDFNIAPEEQDTHDATFWTNRVLVSEAERAAFRQFLATGLQDTFRLFSQEPASFSWWDYRAGSFWRNHGLRIDHILASKTLASQCTRCIIDKNPRKHPQPSDHAPIIAEFIEF